MQFNIEAKVNGYPGVFRRKIDPTCYALFLTHKVGFIVEPGNSPFRKGEAPNWLNSSKWEPVDAEVHFLSENPHGIF